MIDIFGKIDEFFTSLNDYLTFNRIFIAFVALFLVVVIIVIITTAKAYEARLIHTIDMFNQYFIDNPKINEDNLISFNDKMKSDKVPKQLRKQWQSYVLYRDKQASEYMSFENCVSTPIKNSTFKRDITIMNILSYIFAGMSLLLNLYRGYATYCSDPTVPVATAIGSLIIYSLLCPIIILLINFIVTIFLDIRHNAIVSDLYSNYQYFEVNIDKATETLPDYVDYEVLFDKNEIKKGIPILYAYLQKRAEEEQKELERARLKNVEHEKFNFDEAGVERSLVLDRAMQEAENYIAERKKLMEDMQNINNDINAEELNYREVTKEYQRQMQVSKEAFDNYKGQLEQASSSIEINYLKKQQQQELDRQRNLEKDYDTATDRHKKIMENYQEELLAVENEVKKIRKILETSMMSEFDSYSTKVYDAAEKVVEEKQAEKFNKLRRDIKRLEEQLLIRDQNKNSDEFALTETESAETFDEDTYDEVLDESPEEVEEEQSSEAVEEPFAEDQGVEELADEDKVEEPSTVQEESMPAKRRGRPRKEVIETEVKEPKRRGRPRKEVKEPVVSEPKRRGRPRKEVTETEVKEPKRRGRPPKASVNSKEIEDFLREIDAEIAKENEKIANSQKELEKKANRIAKNKSKK